MDPENSEYSLNWEGHTQHIKKAFSKLLHNNDLCDVSLYAEGQKIGAHKVFLSACSKYFDCLFKEFKDERPVVVLKGIQFDILKHILTFVYNGQANVEVYQLKQFLEAAAFLKIDGLTGNNLKRRRKTSSESDGTNDSGNTTDAQSKLTEKEQPSKDSFPKPSKLFKITSPIKNPKRISPVSDPDFSKAPVIGKYPVHTSTQGDEWQSDYEVLYQKNIAHRTLHEDSNDFAVKPYKHTIEKSMDESENLNITIIKSEPIGEGIETDIEAISSLDQIDFSNSLDAEIEIISNDGEDGELEKHLLTTPMASIDEKGYHLCNICDKSYVKKDSLKKHFAVHVNNTTCTICGKMLSRKSHLIRHYLLSHGISSK